jgi:hypothetical protein
MVRTLVSLLFLLVACGSDGTTKAVDPEPVDLVRLGPGGACGDVFFWATTADDKVAVTVMIDAPERSTTEPLEASYDVGDPAMTVTVLRGDRLSSTFCTDVLIGDPVDSQAPASAGTADVRLDPGTPDMLGCGSTAGSVTVSGLEGDDLSFAAFRVDSEAIGCYAG